MTTRIATGGPSTGVSASASAARVTAAPAQPFKSMMSAGAGAILSGAEQAVTRLPGGPILAAALRSGPSDVGSSQLSGAAAQTSAPEGASGTASSAAGAGPGAEGSSLESALQQSANQNLYFIEIQERISAESRNYSTISNVLKARHDTVKNAIGNIR